jgi:hypothetical protein
MSSDGTSSSDLSALLTSIAGFTTIFEDLFALEITAANSATVQAQNASTFAAAAATSAASASSLVATVANDATAALTNATNAGTSATTAASAATQAAGSATTASSAATTAQNAANAAAAVQAQLNTLYEFSSTGGSVTLSAAQASAGIIWVQGNLTSNLTITLPATVHTFILDNSTTGIYTVTVNMTGGTASVGVGQGNANQLFCDGSTGIYSVSSVSGLQFTGVKPISAATNALTNQYQGAYTPMTNGTGGTYVATLPQGATMGVGGAVFLDALSGKWSVKPNGSDTADFGTAFAMSPADKAMFTWNGSSWRTTMYTNQSSPVFSVSLTVPVAYITRGVFGGVSDDGTTALQATTGRFTTSLTVPTMTLGDNSFNAANTAFVYAAINALIGGAPGNLDTLNELAAAINDDTSFSATLTNLIATKAAISGQTFTGGISAPTVTATTSMTTQGYGGNAATGIIYLGSSGSKYLLWDGTSYNLPGASLKVNSSTVWTAATFSPTNYAALAASNAFSGWISSTESGGGLSAAIAAAASNTAILGSYSTGAGLALKSAATAADQSVWDIGVNGTTMWMRAVNDAGSATTTLMDAYRTGYQVTYVSFMPNGGRVLLGPNVVDDTYTPVQVSAALSVQRISGGGQAIAIIPAPVNVISGSTQTNNVITSYSATGNAKYLMLNATTDTLDTPLTSGTLGIAFCIASKQIAEFLASGNLLIGGTSDDGSNRIQVFGGGIAIKGSGYGLTFPDGTTQTTAYAVTAPSVQNYIPANGVTTFQIQNYGLGQVVGFSNGGFMVPGQDYTATTGNSVTLTAAANGVTQYTFMTGALFNASNVLQPQVAQVTGTVGNTALTLPFSALAGYLWIFQGGSWLVPGVDFTFSGGTAVTLTAAPTQATDSFTAISLQPVSFANCATQTNVQQGQLTFAADTGVANAYAVAYIPALTAAPVNGQRMTFQVKTTNTGASTLSCNGGTAYPIYGNGHNALTGGELVNTGFVEVVFSAAFGCWIVCDSTGGAQQQGGNLNFVGTGLRITGDMSNASYSNQLAFQTSTLNGSTNLNVLPNGTGPSTQVIAWLKSDPTNSSYALMNISSSAASISTGALGTGTQLPLVFWTNSAERMRINTAGQIYLGGVTAVGAGSWGSGVFNLSTTVNTIRHLIQGHANNQGYGTVYINGAEQSTYTNAVMFLNSSGTTVGNITVTASATAFNTTSDYRLKENVKRMTGAIDRVMQTPVYTYNFINDEQKEEHDGFLAHELAKTTPRAVIGEKDQMHRWPVMRKGHDPKDVKPEDVLAISEIIDPQLVDHSKAVPLLWAALQEAVHEIRHLKNEVAELKKQKR